MAQNDGDLGENLLNILLAQDITNGKHFRTHLIGGKWPTIDVYAEITYKSGMFCFFQVKSTIIKGKNAKLNVRISKTKLNKLSKYNAPTYLVGIELNKKNTMKSKGYIGAINGVYTKGMSRMTTKNKIVPKTAKNLRDEIKEFWKNASLGTHKTNFNTKYSLK